MGMGMVSGRNWNEMPWCRGSPSLVPVAVRPSVPSLSPKESRTTGPGIPFQRETRPFRGNGVKGELSHLRTVRTTD